MPAGMELLGGVGVAVAVAVGVSNCDTDCDFYRAEILVA